MSKGVNYAVGLRYQRGQQMQWFQLLLAIFFGDILRGLQGFLSFYC